MIEHDFVTDCCGGNGREEEKSAAEPPPVRKETSFQLVLAVLSAAELAGFCCAFFFFFFFGGVARADVIDQEPTGPSLQPIPAEKEWQRSLSTQLQCLFRLMYTRSPSCSPFLPSESLECHRMFSL